MSNLTQILPLQFAHILDLNTNIVKLVEGPQTLMLQTNEKLVAGPVPMVVVPLGHYCVINDPVKEYIDGEKCSLYIGQKSIKFHGEPFALYPGEWLADAQSFGKESHSYRDAIKPLPVVKANCALRLIADLDHDDNGVERKAGDKWQLVGPVTYKPRPEVSVEGLISPTIIKSGQVIKIRATQDTVDTNGRDRVTGEEWLVKKPGAYLPGVFEEVVHVDSSYTITPHTALHLKATMTLTDAMGKQRHAGEEWLLTSDMMTEYLGQVGVEVVKVVKLTVVKKGQYAVILNPVDENGKAQLGQKSLRVGLCSFFLHPYESLQMQSVQNAVILSEQESLVLQAINDFTDIMDEKKVKRKTGDLWLINGPCNYIPPIEVEIIKQRSTIPLNKNDGIYVQNLRTGKVRLVMGPCAYRLTATEELWEKKLSKETEELLSVGGGMGSGDIRKLAYFEQSIDPNIAKGRDKTRVVTYRCPSNTAVQINNYQMKTARVVFGPDLVVLGPHENFNVLRLSAGKPKVKGALKSLCLMLGPDFISDIIEVETSDHARLRIQLSFNNYFEVDKTDEASARKIFSVPDFIGFACRQLGGRIRARVALTTFDEFHRYSAPIIQAAVFGPTEAGEPAGKLRFSANNLVISGVDVQSIEPVDVKMRDSLSKSVQLAIEIATKSIEAAASHEAAREEQIARGHLERQILMTEKESERERVKLYELKAQTAAVESTGQAKAEAQAQAERLLIEGQSDIEVAKLKAEAANIEDSSLLSIKVMLQKSDIDHNRKVNVMEIEKQKSFSQIEVNKFREMVNALGPATIVAMANAGPQNQLNLLKGLGLESVLLTDGNSPINLINTAAGLVGKDHTYSQD
ncbi:major vault protein [Plakobranchus ocellatus]|uniref:Major vault protein n=1 Tax=Plakobranchus ocellatus TaxID=259542 RepID=A0AAV4CQW7_9GAST|nr:major vault protein [Plakobranchus ocellatus]